MVCDTVGRVVASHTRGSGLESIHHLVKLESTCTVILYPMVSALCFNPLFPPIPFPTKRCLNILSLRTTIEVEKRQKLQFANLEWTHFIIGTNFQRKYRNLCFGYWRLLVWRYYFVLTAICALNHLILGRYQSKRFKHFVFYKLTWKCYVVCEIKLKTIRLFPSFFTDILCALQSILTLKQQTYVRLGIRFLHFIIIILAKLHFSSRAGYIADIN